MTVPNTFSSGVNTSFSDELNENFTHAEDKIEANYPIASYTSDTDNYNNLTASYVTASSITTPTARKSNQRVLVEFSVSLKQEAGKSNGDLRLYDATDSTSLADFSIWDGFYYTVSYIIEDALTNIGDSKTYLLQARSSFVDYSFSAYERTLKCTLLQD